MSLEKGLVQRKKVLVIEYCLSEGLPYPNKNKKSFIKFIYL